MNGNNTPTNRIPAINNGSALVRLEAETGALARKVMFLEECLQGAFQHIGSLNEQIGQIMQGMANADKQMPGLWMPPADKKEDEAAPAKELAPAPNP